MHITLRLYGSLKTLVGSRATTIEVPENAQLGDLPATLREYYGEELYRLIGGQQAFDELRVLINGRDYFTLDGLQTELADGDTVTILPLVAGG